MNQAERMGEDERDGFFDAARARDLANYALRAKSAQPDDHTDFCVKVAERITDLTLKHIRKAAESGETGTVFRFKNKGIPKEHLEEVIQIVKLRLDELGFNIISYVIPTFFGSTTVFEIEW